MIAKINALIIDFGFWLILFYGKCDDKVTMQAFGGVYSISSLIFCFKDSPFRLIAMILVRNRDKAIVNRLLQCFQPLGFVAIQRNTDDFQALGIEFIVEGYHFRICFPADLE